MISMTRPGTRTPLPGSGISKFGGPFLGHHHFTLSLHDLCSGVEKKILKVIMQINQMNYKAMPQNNNLCLGGYGINN